MDFIVDKSLRIPQIIVFLILISTSLQDTQKITTLEDCRACIENNVKYYCTKQPFSYESLQSTDNDLNTIIQFYHQQINQEKECYCCSFHGLFNSPTLCDQTQMVCSDTMENQPKLFKNFKYGLCKFDQSVCGESRDIFVSNYQQAFNSNYFSTTDTCLWRFIAVSQLEKDTRQIRIRVTDQKRIKIYASILQKTNSAKIVNDLGKEWNVITEVNQGVLAGNLGQESGLIVANITNYVYIVAVPEITGSFVNFEYILSDELTYPSLNDTNSTSSSTSSSSSGTSDEGAFNNYTRKLLSYLLSSIFGLVFIIGLFQIYRQFFSKEAKIRDLIVRDLRKKRQNELMSRQRQQKELKFMTREEYARFTQEGQRLQIEIQHQQHEKIQDALDEQKWQQQKKNNEKGNFNDTENQLDDYMESDANYDNEDVFNGKYKQTDQSLNMLTVNMTQGDLLGGNNLTQNIFLILIKKSIILQFQFYIHLIEQR